jgi:hypothetical protein
MKSAVLPSIRVEPELRQALEASLDPDESLSEFVEASVRERLALRQAQDAVIARGRAALERYERGGGGKSPEQVVSALRERLEAAKRAHPSARKGTPSSR